MSSSSGSSGGRYGPWVTGVPRKCWCGHSIITKMSRSEENPYRRYFRCWFAADHKLTDDQHVFKWVDEALINEVERAANKYAILKGELQHLQTQIAACVENLNNVSSGELVKNESIRESIVKHLEMLELEHTIAQMVQANMNRTKQWLKKAVIASFVCTAAVVVFSMNLLR